MIQIMWSAKILGDFGKYLGFLNIYYGPPIVDFFIKFYLGLYYKQSICRSVSEDKHQSEINKLYWACSQKPTRSWKEESNIKK